MIQPGTLEAVGALRIGDFACGTGALLNAAYEAVLSRYRRRGGNDRDIHPRMMEHALVGADIMPAATHLTASVLSEAVNIQPLIDAFDRLKGNELEALPRIAQDTTRAALDEAAARVARLDGQELAKWRTAIGREPSIRSRRVAV